MDFVQLIQPGYWLTLDPPVVSGLGGNLLFGAFVLFFIFGVIARVVAANRTHDPYVQKIGQRVGVFLVVMGLLGVILFFFSYERVQLFGARFWYPAWMMGVLVWIWFILRFIKRDIPFMRAQEQERKFVSKYLPSKKKKKKKKR